MTIDILIILIIISISMYVYDPKPDPQKAVMRSGFGDYWFISTSRDVTKFFTLIRPHVSTLILAQRIHIFDGCLQN